MATQKATKKTAKKRTPSAKYTKPTLREKIKEEVTAGSKGGRPGQWSARKAQLVATEYEKAGGGYEGKRGEKQKSLKQWGDEKWHTRTGKKAVRGKKTSRYLPDKAWNELSDAEKKATDSKKEAASKKGKQFVKNTKKAAAAGKRVRTAKKTSRRV